MGSPQFDACNIWPVAWIELLSSYYSVYVRDNRAYIKHTAIRRHESHISIVLQCRKCCCLKKRFDIFSHKLNLTMEWSWFLQTLGICLSVSLSLYPSSMCVGTYVASSTMPNFKLILQSLSDDDILTHETMCFCDKVRALLMSQKEEKKNPLQDPSTYFFHLVENFFNVLPYYFFYCS